MSQLIYGVSTYFERRGHNLNNLGIACLALNKFISSYIDSKEPFPPTKSFFDQVKKNVSVERFPHYIDAPDRVWTSMPTVPEKFELIKKRIAETGFNVEARISHRKKAMVASLVQLAELSFIHAHSYFIVAQVLSSPTEQKNSGEMEDFERLISISLSQSDAFTERVCHAIGWWSRRIEEQRKKKKGTSPINETAGRKRARQVQWVNETYWKIKDRDAIAEHPYTLAKEMHTFQYISGPEKEKPSIETIVRILREEKLIK